MPADRAPRPARQDTAQSLPTPGLQTSSRAVRRGLEDVKKLLNTPSGRDKARWSHRLTWPCSAVRLVCGPLVVEFPLKGGHDVEADFHGLPLGVPRCVKD